MRRRRKNWGCAAAAFGLGLLIAVCFPEKALVVILSAVVVLCGFFLCNR